MTIAVDCRHLASSGVGVYLRGILPFFLESGNFFYLLGNAEKIRPFACHYKSVKIIECRIKPFSVNELLFFPGNILKIINSCDLFYTPFFNIPGRLKIPVYTTIHDLIFHDMPGLTSKTGFFVRNFFYKRAHNVSKKIFTVSEFSKSRITHHFGDKTPVAVTYSAIQPEFIKYRANAGNTEKKETIVFVGNIKKHKGLGILLEAFLLAKKEGLPHKLVIIGEKESFRTADKSVLKKTDLLASENVFITGFVSEEQLMEHICSAALLVQPSLHEGFCLPPLEALVLGTNALISDIPVLREIFGGFPVTFFNAGDTMDLKNKMVNILSQNMTAPELSCDLISKYTFEKTASTIIKELQ